MRNTECGMKKVVFLTSLGWVGAIVSVRGIRRIALPKKNKKTVERELDNPECKATNADMTHAGGSTILKKAVKLLQRYFSGERVLFDLPLDLRYSTRFQRAVWKAVAGIPYGETRSYAWIAKRIRNPRASRAVGQAVGANPVPIIIP